jgi:pimeloyl-ACP methyl ester carboxylesterase
MFDEWLAGWPAWPACVDHVENTHRMDRVLEDHELPEALDLDAPALLLTGTDGPKHLRESVRAVEEALADSRLEEFDGVTHLGPVTAPERTVASVRSFIEAHAHQPQHH